VFPELSLAPLLGKGWKPEIPQRFLKKLLEPGIDDLPAATHREILDLAVLAFQDHRPINPREWDDEWEEFDSHSAAWSCSEQVEGLAILLAINGDLARARDAARLAYLVRDGDAREVEEAEYSEYEYGEYVNKPRARLLCALRMDDGSLAEQEIEDALRNRPPVANEDAASQRTLEADENTIPISEEPSELDLELNNILGMSDAEAVSLALLELSHKARASGNLVRAVQVAESIPRAFIRSRCLGWLVEPVWDSGDHKRAQNVALNSLRAALQDPNDEFQISTAILVAEWSCAEVPDDVLNTVMSLTPSSYYRGKFLDFLARSFERRVFPGSREWLLRAFEAEEEREEHLCLYIGDPPDVVGWFEGGSGCATPSEESVELRIPPEALIPVAEALAERGDLNKVLLLTDRILQKGAHDKTLRTIAAALGKARFFQPAIEMANRIDDVHWKKDCLKQIMRPIVATGDVDTIRAILPLLSAGVAWKSALRQPLEKILSLSHADGSSLVAGLLTGTDFEYASGELDSHLFQLGGLASKGDDCAVAMKFIENIVDDEVRLRALRTLEKKIGAAVGGQAQTNEALEIIRAIESFTRDTNPNSICSGNRARTRLAKAQSEGNAPRKDSWEPLLDAWDYTKWTVDDYSRGLNWGRLLATYINFVDDWSEREEVFKDAIKTLRVEGLTAMSEELEMAKVRVKYNHLGMRYAERVRLALSEIRLGNGANFGHERPRATNFRNACNKSGDSCKSIEKVRRQLFSVGAVQNAPLLPSGAGVPSSYREASSLVLSFLATQIRFRQDNTVKAIAHACPGLEVEFLEGQIVEMEPQA
jgi:hypothetical protein